MRFPVLLIAPLALLLAACGGAAGPAPAPEDAAPQAAAPEILVHKSPT
jgi:hypothetical protein